MQLQPLICKNDIKAIVEKEIQKKQHSYNLPECFTAQKLVICLLDLLLCRHCTMGTGTA